MATTVEPEVANEKSCKQLDVHNVQPRTRDSFGASAGNSQRRD